jgi:hypothetical protein
MEGLFTVDMNIADMHERDAVLLGKFIHQGGQII